MAKGMRLSEFKSDPVKSANGVWVKLNDEGTEIKVARMSNPAHRKLVNELMASHRGYERTGQDLPVDIARSVGIEAMAKTILLDWKGFIDDDGNDVPYSYDNAKEALAIDDFSTMVLGFASDRKLFKSDNLEDNLKNSAPPSNGKSTTDGAA